MDTWIDIRQAEVIKDGQPCKGVWQVNQDGEYRLIVTNVTKQGEGVYNVTWLIGESDES